MYISQRPRRRYPGLFETAKTGKSGKSRDTLSRTGTDRTRRIKVLSLLPQRPLALLGVTADVDRKASVVPSVATDLRSGLSVNCANCANSQKPRKTGFGGPVGWAVANCANPRAAWDGAGAQRKQRELRQPREPR